jgi:hypothetical protein
VNEVGLYGLLQGQAPSVIRISIMYECFNAVLKFLACALENTLEDMADWTAVEWRSLNFAIMLSIKTSIILNSAYVNSEGAQQAAWLGKCFDTMVVRAQEMHKLRGSQCSYFMKLAHEWANMKMYHQNCIQRHQPFASVTTGAPSSKAHIQQQIPTPMQQQQQPPPPASNQYFDAAFDLDPFSELFWGGFGDTEPGMSGMFPV